MSKETELQKVLEHIDTKFNEIKEELKEFTKQEVTQRFEEKLANMKDDQRVTAQALLDGTQQVSKNTADQIVKILKQIIQEEVPYIEHRESIKKGEKIYRLREVEKDGQIKKVKISRGSVQEVLGRLSETADLLEAFFQWQAKAIDNQLVDTNLLKHLLLEVVEKIYLLERYAIRNDGGSCAVDGYKRESYEYMLKATQLATKDRNEMAKKLFGNGVMVDELKKGSRDMNLEIRKNYLDEQEKKQKQK